MTTVGRGPNAADCERTGDVGVQLLRNENLGDVPKYKVGNLAELLRAHSWSDVQCFGIVFEDSTMAATLNGRRRDS